MARFLHSEETAGDREGWEREEGWRERTSYF